MKRLFTAVLSLWLACVFSLPLAAQPQTELFEGTDVIAGEVIVTFKTPEHARDAAERQGAIERSIAEIVEAHDINHHRPVGGAGAHLFHSRSRSVESMVRAISSRPDVAYAEPNYVIKSLGDPNDPNFFPYQWPLKNSGQNIPPPSGQQGIPGADIKATLAWDVSTGSRANVMAIIDLAGIDYTHPDLAANMWSAPSNFTITIGGTTYNCPAGSHGFNLSDSATPCDPMEFFDHHATIVAGIAGAVGNNSIGVSGVNWTASIMSIKMPGNSSGALDAIEAAIQIKQAFAATGGANVRALNNSYFIQAGFSQALLDQINRANTFDMLFVAAAGNNATNNDQTPVYPASYNAPNVVAVANTDNRDNLYFGSAYGANSVHLGAPGTEVFSTILGGGYNIPVPGLTGTSASTPHVVGAAALVLSRCSFLNTAELKANILSNVDPIPALAGKTVTGGRLNVDKGVRNCGATLTVIVSGLGKVTSNPTGILCPGDCLETYRKQTTVTLTASGKGSLTWTGCDSANSKTCTVTMNTDRTVRARFIIF